MITINILIMVVSKSISDWFSGPPQLIFESLKSIYTINIQSIFIINIQPITNQYPINFLCSTAKALLLDQVGTCKAEFCSNIYGLCQNHGAHGLFQSHASLWVIFLNLAQDRSYICWYQNCSCGTSSRCAPHNPSVYFCNVILESTPYSSNLKMHVNC